MCIHHPANVAEFQRRVDQYAQMQQVYVRTGGLVESGPFVQMLRPGVSQPLSMLAKRLVHRALVHFQWNGRTLIPMFQVCADGIAMRPYLAETLHELVDVFDDWEVAHWFSQPNCLLSGVEPAVAIQEHAEAVFLAARADRFIAKG